jgi:zona occludens toxin (predicted ATPase)
VGARPIRTRRRLIRTRRMKIDAATTTATDYCYSLKLILQKQQPKNQIQQQKTNKQTRKQENLRIYSSRKKKKEAKTNLELLFSSELLFCSVLLSSIFFFLFFLLYSVGLPSLLLSPQLLAIQKSRNSKGIVVSVNRRP